MFELVLRATFGTFISAHDKNPSVSFAKQDWALRQSSTVEETYLIRIKTAQVRDDREDRGCERERAKDVGGGVQFSDPRPHGYDPGL